MASSRSREAGTIVTEPDSKPRPTGSPATKRRGRALQITDASCAPLDGAEHSALGFSYSFDAAKRGEPYPVSVRFTGRRSDVTGKRGKRDSFEVIRTLDRVLPGSGRVVMTVRVFDLPPGAWEVSATPLHPSAARTGTTSAVPSSARRTSLPKGRDTGATGFAPLVGALSPGTRLGSWPALVLVGTAVALIVQAWLATQREIPTDRLLLVSLAASLAGLFGAKAYYLVTHRGEKVSLTGGMSIQGFVVIAIPVAAVGAWLAGLPPGEVLDVTSPGLLFGMAIGRWGCFFGGCCAGRPTGSRWGLWASDRKLGLRRIPVQLIESLMAGLLGVVAALAVLFTFPGVSGVIFAGSVAAYTFARQVLFPLRDIPRATAHGRIVTMAIAGLVTVLAITIGLVW